MLFCKRFNSMLFLSFANNRDNNKCVRLLSKAFNSLLINQNSINISSLNKVKHRPEINSNFLNFVHFDNFSNGSSVHQKWY